MKSHSYNDTEEEFEERDKTPRPNRQPLIADHTTWCDNSLRAGVSLAKILNENGDEKAIRIVNSYISLFQKRLKYLDEMPLSGRKYFRGLLYKTTTDLIKNCKFEENVESHLLNVIATFHKKSLRQDGN